MAVAALIAAPPVLAQTKPAKVVTFDDEKQAPQGFASLARAW